MVIVDHDTGHLVWARAGRDTKTLEAFFDELGEERCKRVRLVSADGAGWIGDVVKERCANATRCMDPFHVVQVRHEAPFTLRCRPEMSAEGFAADAHAVEVDLAKLKELLEATAP